MEAPVGVFLGMLLEMSCAGSFYWYRCAPTLLLVCLVTTWLGCAANHDFVCICLFRLSCTFYATAFIRSSFDVLSVYSCE